MKPGFHCIIIQFITGRQCFQSEYIRNTTTKYTLIPAKVSEAKGDYHAPVLASLPVCLYSSAAFSETKHCSNAWNQRKNTLQNTQTTLQNKMQFCILMKTQGTALQKQDAILHSNENTRKQKMKRTHSGIYKYIAVSTRLIKESALQDRMQFCTLTKKYQET